MSQHPMDDFPVRPLRFDLTGNNPPNPVWSQSSPDFAIFINALGIHVPYFERFLVRTMRAFRGEINDEKLLSDLKRIIGQEAHHAYNFVDWTRAMSARYPGLDALDKNASRYFEAADRHGKKFRVGFTAGYETFTFLGGMIILDRYEELMADADPTIRALWVWHQVEEVEHGSVAFDFYKALYPDDEWYRRGMVLFTFGHIAWETFKAFRVMLRGEGFSFSRRLKAWRFFTGFARDLFLAATPVFSRAYHPRNHPICTDHQNRIAVAWRAWHAAGRPVDLLTDDDMRRMQEFAHVA